MVVRTSCTLRRSIVHREHWPEDVVRSEQPLGVERGQHLSLLKIKNCKTSLMAELSYSWRSVVSFTTHECDLGMLLLTHSLIIYLHLCVKYGDLSLKTHLYEHSYVVSFFATKEATST